MALSFTPIEVDIWPGKKDIARNWMRDRNMRVLSLSDNDPDRVYLGVTHTQKVACHQRTNCLLDSDDQFLFEYVITHSRDSKTDRYW